MGAIPEGKTPNIHHLWPHHRSIARAMSQGARPGEVAEAYGLSTAHVTRIINSPLFLAELGRLESQQEIQLSKVQADLECLAERATDIISSELETMSDSEEIWERKTKLETCFKILDRAGYARKDEPPAPQEHKHLHLHVEGKTDAELYKDVMELTRGTG